MLNKGRGLDYMVAHNDAHGIDRDRVCLAYKMIVKKNAGCWVRCKNFSCLLLFFFCLSQFFPFEE